MAIQVPRYERQIQAQGLPQTPMRTEAPLEAFGGGQAVAQTARMQQEVIGKMIDITQKAKDEADTTRVNMAEKDLLQFKMSILNDPQKGALSKRGDQAFGITETYTKTFQEYSKKIEDQLANDRQKAAFKNRANNLGLSLFEQLENHTRVESEKFYEQETKSYLKAKANDIVLNYQDPAKVIAGQKEIEERIKDYGSKLGLPKEQISQMVVDTKSDLNKQVVNMYLAEDNDLAAKQYFEYNKTNFNSDDLTQVSKAIEVGSLRGESQRAASDIISKSKNDITRSLEEANKIQDPKLKDETIERVKKYFADKKWAERLEKEDEWIMAGQIMEQTKDFDKVPDYIKAKLTPGEINTLKGMAKSRIQDDLEAYQEIEEMSSNPATMSKFKDINLYQKYGDRLTPQTLKKYIDIQGNIREGKVDAIQARKGTFTNIQIINASLGRANIKKGSKSYAKAYNYIEERVTDFESINNRKASPEEIEKIVTDATLKVVVEGKFFGTNEKAKYELGPEEKILAKPNEAQRKNLVDAFKKKYGREPNEMELEYHFSEWQKRQGVK